MNDDELKQLWQRQPLRVPDLAATQLIPAMQNKMGEFRRTLFWRDIRELSACIFLVIVFGFYFVHQGAPIARLGDLIVIGSSIFIAWRLLYVQRTTRPAPPGASTVESLRAELNTVRAQSQLLGSVLWWYLLPLTVGELVFVWGGPINGHAAPWAMVPTDIVVTLVIIAVNVFVYWLNQWARRKQLLPVEAQLQSLLRSAESGEPLNQAEVASLRTVALSMTVAGQARPAEFKVAFWQIAIHGEVGFVGMWFILMMTLEGGRILRDLSRLSVHFVSQVFTPLHLLWLAGFFAAGLIYSWILQRKTERAVGISRLGIHLHKGQDLILWDEIKEVRPLRVLNIRSLWLIKETGEKTIMPWSSLERQAELKAAVENCAPADHPIRKHLSLPAMNTKTILILLLIALAGCVIAVAAQTTVKPNSSPGMAPPGSIEAIRQKYNLPALAVVVAKDGQICDRAAAGVRKWGDPTPVTTNDQFHIGSCTKSMTATLAGILIDEGKLRWDTTIAEVFPELKGKMARQYETVTVEQLLHHRGGVPGEPPSGAWARAWQEFGTPTQQRREFIEAVLREPPAAVPGEKEIYSNQGYAIVGAMLEKITGRDFESLMTEKLFKPLHMDSAGFGAPGAKGKVDQPWGHVHKMLMTIPVQADNPPAISPAGRVHCSLDDLARYAMLHLQENAANGLLKPGTLARLHHPDGLNISSPLENYACGWVVLQRDWAGGRTLWHNGSNTMWYIVMWLAPDKNFCVIAATNIAGDDAQNACDDAATAMIQKWLPQ
jgi:CubicO group peptidase (beta-lactamase class C family)